MDRMPITNEERRRRLERLLDLAQVYRGWTRRELAKSLGRDPTKLIPGSGNPKLDLVISLSEVLDWTVGEVTDCLWAALRTRDRSNQMNSDSRIWMRWLVKPIDEATIGK